MTIAVVIAITIASLFILSQLSTTHLSSLSAEVQSPKIESATEIGPVKHRDLVPKIAVSPLKAETYSTVVSLGPSQSDVTLTSNDMGRLYLTGSAILTEEEYQNVYDTGSALLNEGRNQEAIDQFDKLLAINPNDVNTLNLKALALSNLGRSDEAIELYDIILAIDPNDVGALNNKANELSMQDREEEAIELWDR